MPSEDTGNDESTLDDAGIERIGGAAYARLSWSVEHSECVGEVTYWLVHYKQHTPGPRLVVSAATILAYDETELQPDAQLFCPSDLGGEAWEEDGYLYGPSELIVEVGISSRPLDLGAKKREYEAAGVREYVFVGKCPDQVHWFVRRRVRFGRLRPGPDGIYRSEVFPGLWLDPAALFASDLHRLIAVLDQGLATPEHAAFVARLAEARGQAKSGASSLR